MSILAWLVPTPTPVGDWALTLLRVVAGFTFFLHGWIKLTAMGVAGVSSFFGSVGLPAPMLAAPLVIALEVGGGAALTLGLLTRLWALLFVVEMLVALFVVHLPNGFFVDRNGFELVLLLATMAATTAALGPGTLALDRLLCRTGTAAPWRLDRESAGGAAR